MATIIKEGTIDSKEELHFLNQIVQSLLGQQCWNITREYGGTYNFDFGKKVEFSNTFMGEYYLRTHGTDFIIGKFEDTIVIDTSKIDIDEPKAIIDIQKRLDSFLNAYVQSAQIDFVSLAVSVKFSNSYYLKVIPTTADNDYGEPYWSFCFPKNRFLFVSPNRLYRIEQQ